MTRDMFTEWSKLLGRTTLDQRVIELLRDMGVSKPPKVPRDEFSVDVYAMGINLVFEDAEMYPDSADKAGRGVGVLQHVGIFVTLGDDLYKGPIPLGLDASDNRSTVTKKLGEPVSSDTVQPIDYWKFDEKTLLVQFSDETPDACIEAIAMYIEAPG